MGKNFRLNFRPLLALFDKRSSVFIFLTHWAAWLLLHFITFLPSLVKDEIANWQSFVFYHFILVSISFFLFYVVAFFVMPVMARVPKKWFWVIAGSLVLAILGTYLKFRLEQLFTVHVMNNPPMGNPSPNQPASEAFHFSGSLFRSYFEINILTNVSVVVVAFAYRLLLIWFQQEQIKTELQNQTLRAELSFLKMQVNPHFLFNALNNIYSMAIIEDSKQTSKSILKLSDLMRYMLYEKEDAEHKVSLEHEIIHINNYIDLEKLQHADAMYVNFSIEGELRGKRIAPLLLFPLIENAFKHGVVTDAKKPLTIELKLEGRRMHFRTENFKNSHAKDKAGGIGVGNVRKRLDLLYGDQYTFHVTDSQGKYIVDLNIPL